MNRNRVEARNAVQSDVDKKELSWKKAEDSWRRSYVASSVRKTGAQFHDTHANYSSAVRAMLNKMATSLRTHLATCQQEPCKSKSNIPPPYQLLLKLFKTSAWLKKQVTASNPCDWKKPFIKECKIEGT